MYIKSSEVISKGSKSYLRVFLAEEYPYIITERSTQGDVKREFYELYFEEPNMSDLISLRSCSLSINKLYQYVNQTQALRSLKDIPADVMLAMMQKRVDEKMSEEFENKVSQEAEQREITEEEPKKELKANLAYRSFMSSLLEESCDFSNSETDYFREVDKFINLIDSKCRRDLDGNIANIKLDILDKYGAVSFFIKKSIISEYVGFFFSHFPCQILHDQE